MKNTEALVSDIKDFKEKSSPSVDIGDAAVRAAAGLKTLGDKQRQTLNLYCGVRNLTRHHPRRQLLSLGQAMKKCSPLNNKGLHSQNGAKSIKK